MYYYTLLTQKQSQTAISTAVMSFFKFMIFEVNKKKKRFRVLLFGSRRLIPSLPNVLLAPCLRGIHQLYILSPDKWACHFMSAFK